MTRLAIFCIAATLFFCTTQVIAQNHYTVYLLGGQSNAAGKAPLSDLPANLQTPQTEVQIFHGDNNGNGIWQDLQPGLSQEGSNFFGPEITMGRDLANANPDANIRIIKYALGDTTLHTNWNPSTPGPQYTAFDNTVSNALAALISDGDTFSIEGMAWMQGESDGWSRRSSQAQAQAYSTNLTNLVAAVRTDLGIADLPFVIGKISDSDFWDLGEFIRNGQEMVSQSVAHTFIVDTDDLNLIERLQLHYDAPGQQALGTRFAAAFASVPEPALLGDVDLSGAVNFLDISAFILLLSGGGFQAEADCDESGEVNFLDISPFIGILSGS